MTITTKIIIGVFALATAFAVGRWTGPTKIKTEIKTVTVEKIVYKSVSDKEVHKVTTTTTVKKPDGTVTTTTVTRYDSDTHTNTDVTDNTNTSSTSTTEIEKGTSKTTVLALAGMDLTKASTPDWGGMVSRSVLGPVSVGIGAFQSGKVFGGIGLQF